MYKDGTWGEKQKARSKKRLEYFREYSKTRRIKKGDVTQDSIGTFGEMLSLQILDGAKQVFARNECDLIWNNYKVDVKTSELHMSNKRNISGSLKNRKGRWRFSIFRQKTTADYYLLICLKNRCIQRVFLLPNSSSLGKYLTIQETSHRLDNFEILGRN